MSTGTREYRCIRGKGFPESRFVFGFSVGFFFEIGSQVAEPHLKLAIQLRMIFKSCLYLLSAEITGLVCVELESDFRTPRKALPIELVPPAEPQPPESGFQKVSILDILYQEKFGVY